MNPAERAWEKLKSHDGLVIDGAVAVGFFVFAMLIFTADEGSEDGIRDPDVWSVALLTVQTLPLAVRRRWPLQVFLTMMFAGVVVRTAVGYPLNGAGNLATLFAFFTVIDRTDMRTSLGASGAAVVGLLVIYSTTRETVENPWEEALDGTVAFVGAWLIGTFTRTRRQQSQRDAERLALMQEEREAIARLAIAEERTAIARELHDAVGHALNLIVIQASAARRVFKNQPERSADALAAIESAGRQALTDMDRMLGLLREDGRRANEDQTAPGVGDLTSLVRQTEEAGLPVEMTVTGNSVPLPQTVDQSVYRIVQEALTNCLKHAGPTEAHVDVSYLDGAIELTISDDGIGPGSSNSSGRGLIGMRERVRLFGGDFEAGARAEGGFKVWAKIPFARVAR